MIGGQGALERFLIEPVAVDATAQAVTRANAWVGAARPIITAWRAVSAARDDLCDTGDHDRSARSLNDALAELVSDIEDHHNVAIEDNSAAYPWVDDGTWDASHEHNERLEREVVSVDVALHGARKPFREWGL